MEIDVIKSNEVEILELKGKITEINHSLQGLNSRSILSIVTLKNIYFSLVVKRAF